jgi:hypothetical protein
MFSIHGNNYKRDDKRNRNEKAEYKEFLKMI